MRKPFLIAIIYCFCFICSGEVFSQPIINSFNPTSGPAGTLVLIKGTDIGTVSAVSFGGVPAASFHTYTYLDSVTHLPDTVIYATVGTGATGLVTVVTAHGSVSLGTYTFTTAPLPPVIYSFSPGSGGTGTTITIKGKYFGETNGVSFGGIV